MRTAVSIVDRCCACCIYFCSFYVTLSQIIFVYVEWGGQYKDKEGKKFIKELPVEIFYRIMSRFRMGGISFILKLESKNFHIMFHIFYRIMSRFRMAGISLILKLESRNFHIMFHISTGFVC